MMEPDSFIKKIYESPTEQFTLLELISKISDEKGMIYEKNPHPVIEFK